MSDTKNLNVYEEGEPHSFNPSTNANSILYKNTKLDDVLDTIVPIRLTRAEYDTKLNNGEIEDGVIYEVLDDEEGLGINDAIVTESSTFSSKKIVEMIATLGNGGTIVLGSEKSNMNKKTVTIDLSPTKWEGLGPWSQTVSNSYIDRNSSVMISLSSKLDESDFEKQSIALAKSSIRRINHNDNKITFVAYGKKPDIHIIIDAVILN